jgi:hypothetical protein
MASIKFVAVDVLGGLLGYLVIICLRLHLT